MFKKAMLQQRRTIEILYDSNTWYLHEKDSFERVFRPHVKEISFHESLSHVLQELNIKKRTDLHLSVTPETAHILSANVSSSTQLTEVTKRTHSHVISSLQHKSHITYQLLAWHNSWTQKTHSICQSFKCNLKHLLCWPIIKSEQLARLHQTSCVLICNKHFFLLAYYENKQCFQAHTGDILQIKERALSTLLCNEINTYYEDKKLPSLILCSDNKLLTKTIEANNNRANINKIPYSYP